MHYGFATKYHSTHAGCKAVPNIVGYWELIDFCREAKAAGFKLEVHYMLPAGLMGYMADKSTYSGSRRSGPKNIEAYYLCFPVFGSALDCESMKVDPISWQDDLDKHQEHGEQCYVYRSLESHESVFICYCEANDGKSIMRRTSLKELAEMEKNVETLVNKMLGDEDFNVSVF